MNKGGIIALFIFLIGFVSAACNSSQIDINTASAIELDKIINVGPATAEKIIANRTYSSVDDLIRIKGIGNLTLAEIKAQGLACVGEESKVTEETNQEKSKDKVEEEISQADSPAEEVDITTENNKTEIVKEETIELPVIFLNSKAILSDSKDIKTENNKEILKKNLPIYGIIAFCAIFVTAFLLKQRKNKHGFD
jgi:hypothetical protein